MLLHSPWPFLLILGRSRQRPHLNVRSTALTSLGPDSCSVLGLVQHDAVELEHPVDGVGLSVGVELRGSAEPHPSLVLTPTVQQGIGVGIAQAGRPWPDRPLKSSDLKRGGGCRRLSEITTGSGGHDQQLDPGTGVEPGRLRIFRDHQRAIGSAEGPLAVGDDGQVARVTTNATRRTQFGQCLSPLARGVRDQTVCLANHGNPPGQRTCRASVREGGHRILINQAPSHHEMPRHRLGGVLGQCEQLLTGLPVELVRPHVFRQGHPSQLPARLPSRVVRRSVPLDGIASGKNRARTPSSTFGCGDPIGDALRGCSR